MSVEAKIKHDEEFFDFLFVGIDPSFLQNILKLLKEFRSIVSLSDQLVVHVNCSELSRATTFEDNTKRTFLYSC
jgi:BarA-like signal transduction histidine kinase